jgi:hypothetical protein
MKMLYGARLARFDLLRAINHLAGYITKWTPDCDKRLHRIMCYVHTSLHYRMVGFVGDKPQQLSTHLFADADFAGCPDSQRSTSGMHLAIRGPATCFPIAGASKRQTCVSHSTPEAELVAADFALRTAGLPALQLWDVLLQRHAGLVFHEDNQAMIRVCETGRNPTMRHLGRTHRVSVARMHEIFKMPDIHLTYEATHRQSADIYTKGFTEPAKWYAACLLVNIVDGKKLKQLLTNFTIHKFEKEQEDILALFPDPLRKKAIPHDLFNYVAAPSVQRRGGTTNDTTPETAVFDRAPGSAAGRGNDDVCGDRSTIDDTPLYDQGGIAQQDKPLDSAPPCEGPAETTGHQEPAAASTLHRHGAQNHKNSTAAVHGDLLFELDASSSLEILGLLENYDWPNDVVNDIGLTLDKGAPKLGVLTLRHLNLATSLNYHVRRYLKTYNWTTITIDKRTNHDSGRKVKQRRLSVLLSIGSYTNGEVYSSDGSLQIDSMTTDTAFANDRPYSLSPPWGTRYVIELHNDSYSGRVLPEDLHLLLAVGFKVEGNSHREWGKVVLKPGPCPVKLVPDFYDMLFIELCCGDASELCRLEHTTSRCLGVRITARHDIQSKRTLEMLDHCVRELGFGKHVVVWMSFRCTGGSQMQNINEWVAHQEGNLATLSKINDARWEFANHFAAARPLVRYVRGLGGHLALELPRYCSYWSEPLLTGFIGEYGLLSSLFDGCMYGLTAKHGDRAGELMLKHWRLITTSPAVHASINAVCDHVSPHVRIQGRNTKCSENYPPRLAKAIQQAFRTDVLEPLTRDRSKVGPSATCLGIGLGITSSPAVRRISAQAPASHQRPNPRSTGRRPRA